MKTTSACYRLSRTVVDEHIPLDNLRLETSPSGFCVLSYHHLDITKFESAGNQDTITMSFLNRTVRIAGTNLRELAIALQGRAVESIKPLVERYASVSGSDACVKSIEIEDKE